MDGCSLEAPMKSGKSSLHCTTVEKSSNFSSFPDAKASTRCGFETAVSCRLSYVNWLQYAWSALMVNNFQGKDVMYGGEPILEYFSLNNVDMWAYVGYEALFVIFFLVLCWLALSLMRHQKR